MRNKIEPANFWRTFEQILIENGEPFKIIHEYAGKQTHYACVNKIRGLNNNAVDISLVNRDNFLRVGLYIVNRNTRIGRVILANREEINRQLSFTPVWEDGAKNADTLRVIVKFPIDDNTSTELIETALPYIMEFIDVANKYGKNEFFDF